MVGTARERRSGTPLEREVHDSNARPLDGPVGFRDVGPGEDFSDPSPCGRAGRSASPAARRRRRCHRGEEAVGADDEDLSVSAPAEVGREPAIRAGIGQNR